MNHNKVYKELKKLLKERGIKLTIITRANTGSIYCKFDEPRLGKLRIGDHNEKYQVGYRWQVRSDIMTEYETYEKGHRQFYFPPEKLDYMSRRIELYLKKILKEDAEKLRK